MDSQPIDQKSLLIGLIKPTYISVKRNLFLSRITAKQMIKYMLMVRNLRLCRKVEDVPLCALLVLSQKETLITNYS